MLAIRRRTRVVSALPDGESAGLLFGVRLRQVTSAHWGTCRCMSMDWLKHQHMEA